MASSKSVGRKRYCSFEDALQANRLTEDQVSKMEDVFNTIELPSSPFDIDRYKRFHETSSVPQLKMWLTTLITLQPEFASKMVKAMNANLLEENQEENQSPKMFASYGQQTDPVQFASDDWSPNATDLCCHKSRSQRAIRSVKVQTENVDPETDFTEFLSPIGKWSEQNFDDSVEFSRISPSGCVKRSLNESQSSNQTGKKKADIVTMMETQAEENQAEKVAEHFRTINLSDMAEVWQNLTIKCRRMAFFGNSATEKLLLLKKIPPEMATEMLSFNLIKFHDVRTKSDFGTQHVADMVDVATEVDADLLNVKVVSRSPRIVPVMKPNLVRFSMPDGSMKKTVVRHCCSITGYAN